MNLRAVVVSLLALAAAGCFGDAPGSAHAGDVVVVRYTAWDLETGQLLGEANTTTPAFALGSGESGLGLDVERALVGHRQNDTVEVRSSEAAARSYTQTLVLPPWFGEPPANHTVSISALHQDDILLAIPVGGSAAVAAGLNATVIARDATTLVWQWDVREGQHFRVPDVEGVDYVFHPRGDRLNITLEGRSGAEFFIPAQPGLPDAAVQTTVRGVGAGHYRVLASSDGMLRFSYAPDTPLFQKAIRVQATLVQVHTPSGVPAPVGGNYGAHGSPQLVGDPAALGYRAPPPAASSAAP